MDNGQVKKGPAKKSTPINVGSPSLDVDIIFGRPSKNCQYHGICKIERYQSLVPSNYKRNFSFAQLSFDESKDVVAQLDAARMLQEVKEEFFGDGFFEIIEAVTIPEFVNTALGNTFTILPGRYPVEKSETVFQVVFNQVSSKG